MSGAYDSPCDDPACEACDGPDPEVDLYKRAALAVLRCHLASPEDAEFVLAGMIEEMSERDV